MKKDELIALGIAEDAADKILAINGRDIEKHKKAAETAAADLETLRGQLAERDADIVKLRAASGDVDETKKQLDALQAKYDKDTEAYKKQIEDRDYSDAVSAAFASEKVVFTSKGAERSVRDALMANRLPLKDGKLEGFGDRIKTLRDADPDAFKSDVPAPSFTAPIGSGGAPGVSRAAAAARAVGMRYNPGAAAPTGQAGNGSAQ